MIFDFKNKSFQFSKESKMPFVSLMILFFGLWIYFLDQDFSSQQEAQIEFSSKSPAKNSQLKRAFDHDFYVASMDGKLPGAISGILNFENPDDPMECSSDRLYLQKDLKKIPEIFKTPRTKFEEAKIPIECVLYAMRSYMYVTRSNSQYYSYCSEETGMPVRGKKTPCISKDYVYPVYNAYVDVMDCLAIPQTDLLPKLLNESGFHVNILGSGMDAGIGQLTADAITEVTQSGMVDGVKMSRLDYYIKEMGGLPDKKNGRSERKPIKASCERVLSKLSIINEVNSSSLQRCSLIAVPQNPVRNLVYTAIFYRYMLEMQTGINYFSGKNYIQVGDKWELWDENSKELLHGLIKDFRIDEKLRKAGLKEYNMNVIKQMLVTYGYNAGPKTAVTYLSQYLDARIRAIKINKNFTLKPADMSFYGTEVDFNIFRPVKNEKQEAARKIKVDLIMKEPYRGTFPVFLRLVQNSGAKGYLSFVASKYNILNKALIKENLCTSPNYLQF